MNYVEHKDTVGYPPKEMLDQYKYFHLTAKYDKRYIMMWASNTHPEFKPTPLGNGMDSIVGWKPIYKWQFGAEVSVDDIKTHFNNMLSLGQTGSMVQ